jgi:glycosyltransferase involved in cell wall biosynthesis
MEGEVVRFVSIGNLLHWKGFEYGLRAFARANLKGAEYVVIGDGPERQRLELVATHLGIEERVRFLGRLPRKQVLAQLRHCHALVHPSLHDSGGWVCLEAMAAARPVLCFDLGGPAVLVEERAGFRIPAESPAQAEWLLADAMRAVATDSVLRSQMGERGRELVAERYSWDHRGKLMADAYRESVSRTIDE